MEQSRDKLGFLEGFLSAFDLGASLSKKNLWFKAIENDLEQLAKDQQKLLEDYYSPLRRVQLSAPPVASSMSATYDS